MKLANTMVVNFFAGPGAGKTTCAWGIASELKKAGLNVEYVSEYAKELVWDNNLAQLSDQRHLFEIQAHRVDRLIGKVDVIVTDSPILLNIIYDQSNDNALYKEIIDKHNSHQTLNFFIGRGNEYESAGRIHNLEQSMGIDERIRSLLQLEHVSYRDITHENYLKIVLQQVFLLRQPAHPENVMLNGGVKIQESVGRMTVNQFAAKIEENLRAADIEQDTLIALLKGKLNMPEMKAEGLAAIMMQRPDARCVKTLQEWRKDGYHLKPGEFGQAIKVITAYRQQSFQRDGAEVNVLEATQEEKQRILSGQIEVKDTILNKMQLVFDITQTDCAPVDYSRVLYPMYQYIDPQAKYNMLKANIVEMGFTVREVTLPMLSQQGYYDQDKKEILINNSLKDYQQLAALCEAYGTCLIIETSTQPDLVKTFEAAFLAMTLKSALGLPVDDDEVKRVAQKYNDIPNHSIDTLDSSMTRSQRANTKTMSEVDHRYQSIMQEKGLKMDMTRQDSVSQNFLQGLE